jgi:hypothetical protein
MATGQELIIKERAELGTELHSEVAFEKGGLHGGRSRRGHWGAGVSSCLLSSRDQSTDHDQTAII